MKKSWLLLFIWMSLLPSLAMATAAGSLIQNQAFATYTSALGQTRTVTSNIVEITVAKVCAAVLTQNQSVFGVIGETGVLTHQLIHVGNGSSNYRFTLANVSGDAYDVTNLSIHLDSNQNGQIEANETALTPGDEINLIPNEIIDLLVSFQIPSTVSNNQVAAFTVNASCDSQLTVSNTDTITASAGAANLTLSKSVDKTEALPGEVLTYQLALSNSGGAAKPIAVMVDGQSQDRLVLRDGIPANTQLLTATPVANATVLYHLAGQGLHDYQSTPPSDLSTVDAIALAFEELASDVINWSFQVKIRAATQVVNGQSIEVAIPDIVNQGEVYDFIHPDGLDSNPVITVVESTVTPVPAVIQYFTNNTFDTIDRVAFPGETLFVGVNAPICNASASEVDGITRVIQIRITSLLTGDDEVFTAVESQVNSIENGSNTGWFYIRPPEEGSYVPSAEALVGIPGNGILETVADDILTASLDECNGQRVEVTTEILIDPAGVVFDSQSNQPIAGATVTLIDVATGQPATVFQDDGVTPAPNTVVTGQDGRFRFPLVDIGNYRLLITPPVGYDFPSQVPIGQLPSGRNVLDPGSYGGSFPVDLTTGPVSIDVPLDAQKSGVITLDKAVASETVEVGESVQYTLTINNLSSQLVSDLIVEDQPAFGFHYLSGSTLVNGNRAADPKIIGSRQLRFSVGDVAAGGSVSLRYRLQARNAALQGDGVNRAIANGLFNGNAVVSNRARAEVTVEAGVFSDRAFILGKVYLDCNENRWQDLVDPEATAPQSCPEAAPPEIISEKFALSGDVLFAFGKAELSREGQQALDEIINKIKGLDLKQFTIIGHTDRIGSVANNQLLSERRATTVKNYFITQGIRPAQLQSLGRGEQEPLSNCRDSLSKAALIQCLQPDRRVSFALEYVATRSLAAAPVDCPPPKALPQELGVPGVRIYLQDGTYAITDAQGQYSFYGLLPRTYVVKLDRTTLPNQAELLPMSNRFALDDDSAFADLKRGELHKTDFGLQCADFVYDQVKARREKAQNFESELALTVKKDLALEESTVGDITGRPAAGVLNGQAVPVYENLLPPESKKTFSVIPEVPLEDIVLGFADNKLEIINLKDGDVLPNDQIVLRVKGRLGGIFQVLINGEEVSEKQIGKRVNVADASFQAWEYIGVRLTPGENRIKVKQFDPFGNPRGETTIRVIAPGEPAKLLVESVQEKLIADGATPVAITLKLQDKDGNPVTARTFITLETSQGRFNVEDLSADRPGIQVFLQGGEGTFPLIPPLEAGKVTITATANALNIKKELTFLPQLRPLIMAGIIEGVLDFRKLRPGAIQPVDPFDDFEQELRGLASSESEAGDYRGGARASLFLKGKVKGNMLLTLAYDSDKEDETLLRDIDPDRYYPIYGDASVKGYDAQSTGKLYIRLEKNTSYFLLGDFTSGSGSEAVKLGDYRRSLNGVEVNLESARFQIKAFGSYTDNQQISEEIPGRGVSGPYALATTIDNVIVNSEIVEIITRDRDQPALIIDTQSQSRFTDYTLDEFTGGILFNQPIPSVDANLNPVFIRITYEVAEALADERYVYGGSVKTKVTPRLEVGATFAKDESETEPVTIIGSNATLKLAEDTYLTAEVAESKTIAGKGDGYRVELKGKKGRSDYQISYSDVDENFENPTGAAVQSGRKELSVKASAPVGQNTQIQLEALTSEAKEDSGRREGMYVGVQQNLTPGLKADLGARYTQATDLQDRQGQVINEDVLSVRSRLLYQPPSLNRLSVFAEYEQGLGEASDRSVQAIGGEYALTGQSRLYLRHEFINSLSGRYALDDQDEQNSTVFGLDYGYGGGSRLYSEYRVRETIDGPSNQAALGLNNNWKLNEKLGLTSKIERVQVLDGVDEDESFAIALGLSYTNNKNWQGNMRVERRISDAENTWLGSIGFARRLGNNWSLLAKNIYNLQTSNDDRWLRNRTQIGLAYRPALTNRWNSLWKYEYRLEEKETEGYERFSHIFSTHLHYQLTPSLLSSSRLAFKTVEEHLDDTIYRYNGYLASLRLTQDLGSRFNVSLLGTATGENDFDSFSYGLGGEVGVILKKNLWFAVGYNVFGYKDEDFAAQEYTSEGLYLRLRYKFDESFKPLPKPAVATPCTPRPKVTTELTQERFELSGDVLFAFGKASLSPAGQQALNDFVAQIRPYDLMQLKIIGHTDRVGSLSANQRLSERRANMVKNYLVLQGLDPKVMQSEGRGESEPISNCGNLPKAKLVQCLQADRRVEFEVAYAKMQERGAEIQLDATVNYCD